MTAKRNGQGQGTRCPVCGKPSTERHRPFCSRRCADLDLHRWLGEGYRIPTDEAPADGSADDSGDETP